jgi:DNA-binding NtrC family response regulator
MPQDITILVVDDEPQLLRLMQAFLERLGYRVEGFGNAADALRRFESSPAGFDVLIADLTLPDMPGQELAISMFRANPSLRVLICSGYPFELGTLPDDMRPKAAVLQKPFVPKMLAKSIEDLLNRR